MRVLLLISGASLFVVIIVLISSSCSSNMEEPKGLSAELSALVEIIKALKSFLSQRGVFIPYNKVVKRSFPFN